MTRTALRTVAVALLVVAALGAAAGSLGGFSTDLGPDRDGVRTPENPSGGGGPSSAVTGGESIDRATYLRLLAALAATGLVCSYVLFPRSRRVVLLAGCAGVVGAAGYLGYRPDAEFSVPALGTSGALRVAGVALLVGLLAAGALLLRRFDVLGGADAGTDDDRPPGAAPDRTPETDRHPAERTAEDPVERAWQRMVAGVRPSSPGSRTPGEFAAAAKEHGRDPEAVDRLTRLFRAVRYGSRRSDEHAEEAAELAARVADDATADRGEVEP